MNNEPWLYLSLKKNLCICISINDLQRTEWQNSTKTIKDIGNPEQYFRQDTQSSFLPISKSFMIFFLTGEKSAASFVSIKQNQQWLPDEEMSSFEVFTCLPKPNLLVFKNNVTPPTVVPFVYNQSYCGMNGVNSGKEVWGEEGKEVDILITSLNPGTSQEADKIRAILQEQ